MALSNFRERIADKHIFKQYNALWVNSWRIYLFIYCQYS